MALAPDFYLVHFKDGSELCVEADSDAGRGLMNALEERQDWMITTSKRDKSRQCYIAINEVTWVTSGTDAWCPFTKGKRTVIP